MFNKNKKKEEKVINKEEKVTNKDEVKTQDNFNVEVVNNDGDVVRVYTHSKYGENYKLLAEQFAVRTGNKVKNDKKGKKG